MTDQKIPLAGVIGSPVAHSKSPRLHTYWLNRYGLSGSYIPIDVAAADLADVLKVMPKMGFIGANVTIPHKEAVLKLAHDITPAAREIGAANTLVFQQDGSILADNTDGYGFIQNLNHGAPNWNATKGLAAVLGAGGASRAVIWGLLNAGVSKIRLSNRTKERAEILADEFGPRVEVFDWENAPRMLEGVNLCVNTTSLGMAGKASLEVPLYGLGPETIVTDLVYTPLKTDLLSIADQMGCSTVDGLGMLLHQAVPGFEKWFGLSPEVNEDTRKAVLE